jgi:ABC-2 type transport system ATP-binding protein
MAGMSARNEDGPLIRLEGLSKTFHGHLGIGSHLAVDGLTLEVGRGEIFGLLGPNGAGKTTTLKMMLGLLRPTRGRVSLFGRPPQDAAARARLGFLPENPYFYDYLTGREFLDFYARLQGIPAAARAALVERTLRRVGLAARGDAALRKYSKGMIQRLGLAQAIQHDPELVILDEPMSGLDPVGRREVRDLILGLREAGKTVFFSSHILQDAEMLCDRVAIVVDGKLRALGHLDAMISRDVRFYEVSIEGEMPAGVTGDRLASAPGRTILRVADVNALSSVLAKIEGAGGRVVGVWPQRETLEDLFMKEVANARDGGART